MKNVDYGRKFVEILYHIKQSPKEIMEKIEQLDLDAQRSYYTSNLLKSIETLSPRALHYLFEEYKIDANWYVSDYGNIFMLPLCSKMTKLTDKEKEIINLTMSAKSRREMADVLNMGVETVKWHFKNIFQKLGVHSREEIVNLMLSGSKLS